MAMLNESNLLAMKAKAAKFRTHHIGTKLNEAELHEFEALAEKRAQHGLRRLAGRARVVGKHCEPTDSGRRPNGRPIKIGMYFNPTLSPATANALIQSNSNLIRNAGGIQGVKMGMFFGVVNAFQWYANSWK